MEKGGLGHLFVISGPSGVGKDVTVDAMSQSEAYQQCRFSSPKSYTTRSERTNSKYDANYIFVTDEEFENLIEDGEILECTSSHGFMYGTSKADFEKCLQSGNNILKILDNNGARKIKRLYPVDSTIIYMRPPTMRILEQRLKQRGSEDRESFHRRMIDSLAEIDDIAGYDYVITNNDINHTAALIMSIINNVLYEKSNLIGVFGERE